MDRVKPAVQAVAAAQQAHPGFTVGEFGDASTQQQINKIVQRLRQGPPDVAAGHPDHPAARIRRSRRRRGAPAPGADGRHRDDRHLGPLSHVIGGVDSSINEVILLIGSRSGVDYSMFYLRREREERETGRSEEASRPRRRRRAARCSSRA